MEYHFQRTKPLQQGYTAYLIGKSSSENPYQKDTLEFESWEKGWYMAKNDDKEETEGIMYGFGP